MKFYHYTYDTRWKVMQQTGSLQADNGFGRTMPHPLSDHQERPALWGLTEPVPTQWKNHFLWDLLVGCFCYRLFKKDSVIPNSLVLLECDVQKNDDIWVADWGVFSKRTGQPDAEKHYADSMIRYTDFNPSTTQMIAPELVSFSNIPATQARCIMNIPFDQELESIRLFVRNETGIWHGQPSRKKGYKLTP